MINNKRISKLVSPDPLLGLTMLFPGYRVVRSEQKLTQGQELDCFIISETLTKASQIPLACTDLVVQVQDREIVVYEVQKATPTVACFELLGRAEIGQQLTIRLETNFTEYSLRIYSVGLTKQLVAENQKTYVVQQSDAGNYILAELETAEGVYKCQSQQVKLVPQDYFGPRLVYWRDEEAAVD